MFSWLMTGRGRLSEFFDATDNNLNIDIFMRQMAIPIDATRTLAKLSQKTKSNLQNYVDGINYYVKTHSIHVEFLLNGQAPHIWTIEDVIVIGKLLSISKSQITAEKFIINAIKTSKNKGIVKILKKMFFPYLEQMNNSILKHIKKLKHVSTIPEGMMDKIPSLGNGNHFAVMGNKSESTFPLFAFDSITKVDQIPSNWYEITGYTKGQLYVSGITIPGFPFVFSGRNKDFAWGSSFGFVDSIDHFIQSCEKQSCRQGKDMFPLYKRSEWIQRRNMDPVRIVTFQSAHGILELTDPTGDIIPKGLYLSRANSYHEGGLINTLENMFDLCETATVQSAQNVIKTLSLSANFIIVDKIGNIGYQQSGLVPYRRHSGLYPLLAWAKNTQWDGVVPAHDLTSIVNPYFGTISTANDDWNTDGRPLTINFHCGGYRRDRIDALLRRKSNYTSQDLIQIQNDNVSIQGIRMMKHIHPILRLNQSPLHENILQALKTWDYRYDSMSEGASLFDALRREILKDLFSKILDWDTLERSDMFQEYSHYFDILFLDYPKSLDSVLWKGEKRSDMVQRILKKLLAASKNAPLIEQTIVMHPESWTRFLPGWMRELLGIRKRIPGIGSSVTVQYLRSSHNPPSTFASGFKMVLDMKQAGISSVFLGGSSESPISPHYMDQIESFQTKTYRNITF